MLILYLSLREGQTYNVVIIAKRIHLFPYRTQKLSSLAAMVLGGQPPGRVARSHVEAHWSSGQDTEMCIRDRVIPVYSVLKLKNI